MYRTAKQIKTFLGTVQNSKAIQNILEHCAEQQISASRADRYRKCRTLEPFSLVILVGHWPTSIYVSLTVHIVCVRNWSACLHILLLVTTRVVDCHVLCRVLWKPCLDWQHFPLGRSGTQPNSVALCTNTSQLMLCMRCGVSKLAHSKAEKVAGAAKRIGQWCCVELQT